MKRYWFKIMLVEDCWIYTGSLNSGGYGPHRSAYEELVGPIPDGMDLDHLCRVRACINPEHLKPKTRSANLLAPGSLHNRRPLRTHCKHGHPLDEEDTMLRGDGARLCLTCHRNASREWARKRKAA